MNSKKTQILFFIMIMSVLSLLVITFSSVTATNSIAHVKGGSGTIKDPLQIEIEGNVGLAPLLDSLLPFRVVPSVSLSYVGEEFYIPGLNKYFIGNQALAMLIYLISIILFIAAGIVGVMRLMNLRIVIVNEANSSVTEHTG